MKIVLHSTNLLLAAFIVAVGAAPAAYGQQCAQSFAGGGNYVTASLPKSVAIGDLNGDGKADLAVANSGGANVSVLLGNGNGTFAAAVDYFLGAGTNPLCVAIGDVNGDGRLDLAVANSGSNNVSVLLGNGDGTFQTMVNYGAGTSPSSVAIGDFNADGKADLAVANSGSNNVSVLLGNGDGTFQTGVNYNVGSLPYGVSIGDLNGDGKPDLVSANNSGSQVTVLVNSGSGTFPSRGDYTTDPSPYFAAIGDFNGDGKPDLAVACSTNHDVSVLLNTGIGNPNMFAMRVNYGSCCNPVYVAIGDLNGDGRPDLATANAQLNNVSVLLGNGNGTFQSPNFYVAGATGTHPYGVAIGDFNGNGRPDLAVANYNSNYITVLLNTSPMIGISPQPVSQSVTQGQTAVFTATASGTGPLSYHWRRNSAPLSNVGHVTGATTSTLTISNASVADIGAYDVQVSGGCNYAAVATSYSAALSVCAPPVCKGDFNNDSLFNASDIQGIVDALLAGQTCP